MIHNSRIAHSGRLSVGANPVRKVGASEAKFMASGSQVGVGHQAIHIRYLFPQKWSLLTIHSCGSETKLKTCGLRSYSLRKRVCQESHDI
jgi:hypothetical protein